MRKTILSLILLIALVATAPLSQAEEGGGDEEVAEPEAQVSADGLPTMAALQTMSREERMQLVQKLEPAQRQKLFDVLLGGSVKGIRSRPDGGLDTYTMKTVPEGDTTYAVWSVKGGASASLLNNAMRLFVNGGRFSNHPSLVG